MWSRILLSWKRIEALVDTRLCTLGGASHRFDRPLLYVVLMIVSVTLAFSLPWLAEEFFAHWSRVQGHGDLLIVSETAIAILIFLFMDLIWSKVDDLKLAQVAKDAGLERCVREQDQARARAISHLKFHQSIERTVLMLVGTGRRSFVDPEEDLHHVLWNCREAKILLVSPCGEKARMRTSVLHVSAAMTGEMTGDWTQHNRKAIQFLKLLRRMEKKIKLKLFPDPPSIHMLIVEDQMWVRHCDPTRAIQPLPEYMFRRTSQNHGLYTLFHQYFVTSWESPVVPEYDLETDELVYRSAAGAEQKRVPFILEGPTGHVPGVNVRP